MKRILLLAALGAGMFPNVATADPLPVLGADSQDVIFLGASGPVRLRYHLHQDGATVTERWKKFIDQIFDYADRNGDGKLDAAEVGILNRLPLGGNRFDQGVFFDIGGNVFTDFNGTITNGASTFDIASLDADKNGSVSRAELYANLIKKGLGPVKVVISPTGGNAQQLTDALFKHLDKNKDGKLSKEELEAAPEVLAELDQNEDEIITSQEILERGPRNGYGVFQIDFDGAADIFITNSTSAPFQQASMRFPTPDFFVVSREALPADVVKELIARLDKDKNGKLSAAELKMGKEAFAKLDKNGDGQLDAKEIDAWLNTAPDIEFTVPLSGSANAMNRMNRGGRKAASLSVTGAPGPFEKAIQTGEDGVPRVMLPDAILSLSTQAQNQGYFLVNVFNQGGQLDEVFKKAAGADKFVDKKKLRETPELQYLLGIFDAADRNGDGKLELAELKRFMSLQDGGNDLQVQITITDQGRGLFDLIDVNHDDRLGIRELRNAWKQVARLSRDGKSIGRDDLPRQFPMRVNRVNLTQGNLGYAFAISTFDASMGLPSSRVQKQGPIWFQKMDRNGDGDVSRKEFLGPPELFAKLDKDGDGLISLEEALAAEKLK
jgi:Ca2+-binding EF-hand superfamily protein